VKIKNRRKYGQHTTVEFVIDGELFTEKIRACNQGEKQRPTQYNFPPNRLFLKGAFLGELQRVNHHRRERKGNQNPEIQRVGVYDGVHDLTDNAQPEQHRKMFQLVAGITATLGNGKRKEGHGNSAKHSKPHDLRVKHQPEMVDKHKYRRENFDRVNIQKS